MPPVPAVPPAPRPAIPPSRAPASCAVELVPPDWFAFREPPEPMFPIDAPLSVGDTQRPSVQMRSPLQSVSFVHPDGELASPASALVRSRNPVIVELEQERTSTPSANCEPRMRLEHITASVASNSGGFVA